ncbi:paraquat-inducible protein A [Undibacterium terreum]|uniref:paraquat-inducible protein A n=1 Tax=Undibacterium terreum TaxID=1224302 RepID=UPI0016682212|nr:paraquat-inducible protein A [Undibacterium terreum]
MYEVPNLIACNGCDALYRRPLLRSKEIIHCRRCGTELDRDASKIRRQILPLTVASLIIFVISNCFPIIQIEMHGLSSSTTLLGSVLSLRSSGMDLVAMLVLTTTILFPLLHLVSLLYILLALANRRSAVGFNFLIRTMQRLRPWGMVEVFLLGVLVALVKLSSMATIVPGIALWSFGVLTVLLTAVTSFDLRLLWNMANSGNNGKEAT